MSADRDFALVEHADRVAETLLGRAGAGPLTQGERLYAREMVQRFAALSMKLQVAMMDYSPDMTEERLRAWATQLCAEVTG